MAEVEYTCGLAGTVRPAGLIPRNEPAFAFICGAADGMADALGRVAAIRDDNGGFPGATLAEYAYLGLRWIIQEGYPEPEVRLDYDSGTPGEYAGFDRFGRVIDHRWYAYAASADRDRYTYGYDRASNRLYRENTLTTGRDELYGYDQVNRLVEFARGELNANKDAITAATGTDWADPAHDRTGNMTTIPKPANLADGLTATYDAWNRLVEVKDGQIVIARYEYDGVNRRITSHIDSGAPSNPTGIDSHLHCYHNSSWQILETRQSDSPSAQPETLQPKHQYVWSQRYIDAAVLRDEHTGANGLCDGERLYFLNDANFNVTALLDTAGDALERYVYSPYGMVTIYDATWTNTRSESSYANVTLYTGRKLDAETGVYYYRNRYYGAELGVFVSRDPIEADLNPYRYASNQPSNLVDWSGLRQEKCFCDDLERQKKLEEKVFEHRGRRCRAAITCEKSCDKFGAGFTGPPRPVPEQPGEYVIDVCVSSALDAESQERVIEHKMYHVKQFCRSGGIRDMRGCKMQEREAYTQSCRSAFPGDRTKQRRCIDCGVFFSCEHLNESGTRGGTVKDQVPPCKAADLGLSLRG